MNNIASISLIWLAVALSIVTLMTKLGLFGPGHDRIMFTITACVFMASAFFSWFSFVKISQTVLREISSWDETLQRDIPSFIQKRRVRMLTLYGMLTILFVLAWVGQFKGTTSMQETVMYVLIIGSFHCALVSTLVMFKMRRTLLWVQHENQMAKMEGA